MADTEHKPKIDVIPTPLGDFSFRDPSWLPRRIFVFMCAIILLKLWDTALLQHQNTWPLATSLMLLIFVYVAAATAEQITTVFQQAGVVKAIAGAVGAVNTAADLARDAMEKVDEVVEGDKPKTTVVAVTQTSPKPPKKDDGLEAAAE